MALRLLALLLGGAAATLGKLHNGTCFTDPAVCGVSPNFEVCLPCPDKTPGGCCIAPPASVDCYALGNPEVCSPGQWCQLKDHKSWSDVDATTIGRCVQYQGECESCTSTYEASAAPHFPQVPWAVARTSKRGRSDSSELYRVITQTRPRINASHAVLRCTFCTLLRKVARATVAAYRRRRGARV